VYFVVNLIALSIASHFIINGSLIYTRRSLIYQLVDFNAMLSFVKMNITNIALQSAFRYASV
jgi:hypothetical protein